jgi:GH15 family glucan-1,4-alpha-glucosidase
MLEYLESAWPSPDHGIWEARSQPRQFTYSKMMAWVGFDRAVKLCDATGLPGPVNRWRTIRDQIHAEVCARGYDGRRGTFVQFYGGQELDASLLRMPAVGFLPGNDPRVTGMVDAISRDLAVGDGLLLRYSPSARGSVDGISGDEGAFLACSFWLVDALALTGRRREARALFERLLELRNDVGLLAEEYDPIQRRQTGNFPQALSHLALVNTALALSRPMAAPSARPAASRDSQTVIRGGTARRRTQRPAETGAGVP